MMRCDTVCRDYRDSVFSVDIRIEVFDCLVDPIALDYLSPPVLLMG